MWIVGKQTCSMWQKYLRVSKVVMRQEYEFSEDFRTNGNLHYCECYNKKLKYCVDKNRYDDGKTKKKLSSPSNGFQIVKPAT